MNHIVPVAFSAYVLRLLVFGTTLPESLALGAIAALYGTIHFIESRRPIAVLPINERIQKEVDDLKSAVSGLKLGHTVRR